MVIGVASTSQIVLQVTGAFSQYMSILPTTFFSTNFRYSRFDDIPGSPKARSRASWTLSLADSDPINDRHARASASRTHNRVEGELLDMSPALRIIPRPR